MENLSFLIYSSVRNGNCTDAEIKNILASCEKHNPGKNITGVLVHSNNYFLQFLEGDAEEIMGLYNHIKKDSRHSKCILLNKGNIDKRMFPSWHMGYKDADKDSVDLLSKSSEEERDLFNKLLKGGGDRRQQGPKNAFSFLQISLIQLMKPCKGSTAYGF